MKRALLCLSLLVLNYGILSAEEQITITTYYPSPYGSYNALQTDKLGVGDNNGDGSLTSADVPTTSGDTWIKGKVGIGTMNPLAKLTVNNNITGVTPAVPGITIGNPSGTAALWIGKNSDNFLTIDWLDPDRARIFTGLVSSTKPLVLQEYGGNVGIGTTGPLAKLAVLGQATFGTSAFTPPGTEPLSTIGTGSGISMNDRNGVSPRRVIYPSGDILRFWRNGTDQMVITGAGNVGIGTTAPRNDIGWAGALDVNGQIRGARYYDDDVNYYADLNAGGRLGGSWSIIGGGLQVNMGNNNNYFNVNYDNNVGLELRSGTSGGTPYIDFSNDPGSDYDSRIILINGNILQIQDPGQTKVLRLRSPFGFGIDLNIENNIIGFLIAGTFNWATVRGIIMNMSDIRRKKNIKTLTGVLDRLDKVRGVSFNWVSDNDKAIGVIAQEMEIVFPEVVTTDKPAKVKEGIPEEKFVSYAGVSAVTLQGLKELKAVVLAQAQEIKSLKQRLNTLEKLEAKSKK